MDRGEPQPGDWAVLDNWCFEVVRIAKLTEQCFFYQDRGRERRAYRDKMRAWARSREAAERAAEQLTSAKAEQSRREQAARLWFQQRADEIAAKARATDDRTDTGEMG